MDVLTGRCTCHVALPVSGSSLSRVRHFKVGQISTYTFIIVRRPDGKVVNFHRMLQVWPWTKKRPDQTWRNYKTCSSAPQARARNRKERQRSSALPLRTWISILTSCGNQLGSWIRTRCRPCTAHALASPRSSLTILSLPSGCLRHHLPVPSSGLTRRTLTLYMPMQCCSL